MDWNTELVLVTRTLIATGIGAVIGLQREFIGKEAGMRTYAAVALGSCTLGLISQHIMPGTIDTRIPANIVVGIGFLGAGMIVKEKEKIQGLTTAATAWATAAMGMAISFGMFLLGILTGLLIFLLLVLPTAPLFRQLRQRTKRKAAKHVQKNDE